MAAIGSSVVTEVRDVECHGLPGTVPSFWPTPRQGETVHYTVLDDRAVPPQHRVAVRQYADRAARKLGLPRPVVHFVWPAERGPGTEVVTIREDGVLPGGWTNPSSHPRTIWIDAGLRGPALEAAVYHEVAHLLPSTRVGSAEANARAVVDRLLAEAD